MWADKCLPATLDEQQAVAALAVCERFAGSVLEHAAAEKDCGSVQRWGCGTTTSTLRRGWRR
jgi:hypothetical protein